MACELDGFGAFLPRGIRSGYKPVFAASFLRLPEKKDSVRIAGRLERNKTRILEFAVRGTNVVVLAKRANSVLHEDGSVPNRSNIAVVH